MGLLDSFFGKKNTESATTALPYSMRDTLFGDMLVDHFQANGQTAEAPPWSIFMEARQRLSAHDKAGAITCWQSIVNDPAQEPRCHLQAWHYLRQHGVQPAPEQAKQLLGVVLEVSMPGGLDLLAAYADHAARYYNFSGGAIIWEHPDTSLDAHIDQLFEASRQVVERIGPWDKPRPGPPGKEEVRLNFLTPSGLHFGQGPMDVLSNDAMGGPIIHIGAALMSAMIEKASKK
ncbi:hypothetical protein [Brevifollis gellanilyticus]|uniref:Uncharacterized protein n=1 Tax=Brevifollis gellanilyticus TaxID=748831 RepID=A0A512MHR2_9BACT|nr:hypothetical protein [Brevifollis gellanilyticus]GEP46270.1 hypothetical protein BGE01nite_55610 [Brevifollis gellanilyticus]